MELLSAIGWRTLGLDQLLAGHALGEWQPRTFALTFDDGFKNFLEHGLPILIRCRFSATIFAISNWVGKTNDWNSQPKWAPQLELMDWSDLRGLAVAGVEIGAHSANHAHLSRATPQEVEREIVDCKSAIEDRLGRQVSAFAYPYGETSRVLESVVARYFRTGFGTRLGFVTARDSTTNLSRIEMYYFRQTRRLRGLESPRLRAELAIRRWIRTIHNGRGSAI